MKVYIDNNIVVAIENGEYSLSKLRTLLSENNLTLYYSPAHIFEVEHFEGTHLFSKGKFLNQRFQTIKRLFKNNYLYVDLKTKEMINIVEEPLEVYETITMFPSGISSMKMFTNLFSAEKKKEIRDQIGIDPKKLNNYKPTDVIAQLNTKLELWGRKQSFVEMIEAGIQAFPNSQELGLHNRFAGIFELLDMFGYWKDVEKDGADYARLWDALHAFFATYCECFVSDDRRTRYKARVVYDLYNINTKIISTSGQI